MATEFQTVETELLNFEQNEEALKIKLIEKEENICSFTKDTHLNNLLKDPLIGSGDDVTNLKAGINVLNVALENIKSSEDVRKNQFFFLTIAQQLVGLKEFGCCLSKK